MARYLLINSSNIIENAIEADSNYVAPDGYTLVQTEIGNPGQPWPLPAPPAPNPNDVIRAQIIVLENSVSKRRLREAFADPTWINGLNTQIIALRSQLTS